MLDEYLSLLKKVVGEDVKVISSLQGGMMNEAYIVKSKQGILEFTTPKYDMKKAILMTILCCLVIIISSDIVVENAVILELKSVERLLPVHKKQLISYLKLTDMRVGYLINFNEADINNGLERVLYKFKEEDDISQIIKKQ